MKQEHMDRRIIRQLFKALTNNFPVRLGSIVIFKPMWLIRMILPVRTLNAVGGTSSLATSIQALTVRPPVAPHQAVSIVASCLLRCEGQRPITSNSHAQRLFLGGQNVHEEKIAGTGPHCHILEYYLRPVRGEGSSHCRDEGHLFV